MVVYFSITIINVLYVYGVFNYIIFIIVTAMSPNVISYVICVLYCLCSIISTIEISLFSGIDITISVYGVMFINYYIINKKCNVFLDLKLY